MTKHRTIDVIMHFLIQNPADRRINDLEVEQNERCVAQPFVGKEFLDGIFVTKDSEGADMV